MPKGKFLATDDIDLSGHHMTDWRYLADIPQGGAAVGEVLGWDGSSWNPKIMTTSDEESPILVYWGDIIDTPLLFPPEDHTHELIDIIGWPADHGDLSGLGDPDHPLSALQQDGAASNEAIVWGGSAWAASPVVNSVSAGTGIAVSAATGLLVSISHALIGGTGIDITGATISHDLIGGTGVDITGATISNDMVGGTGIDITGDTISHDLIGGTGIDITGATISHDMVAGTSIGITGATISVDSELTDQIKRFSAELVVNGNGSVIANGVKGYLEIPKDCTLIMITTVTDNSDSFTWTIKKSSYSGFPGSLADITGGAGFPLLSAQKAQKTTLSSWTTDFDSGDIVEFGITTTPATTTIGLLSLTFTGDIT